MMITSTEFSVPTWEQVVEHPETETRWPLTPSPNLEDATEDAVRTGRMLIARRHEEVVPAPLGEGDHPYAVGLASGVLYAYQSVPSDEDEIVGYGRVTKRYGFHPIPPVNLNALHEFEDEDMTFHVLVTEEGNVVMMLHRGGDKAHIVIVSQPGEPITVSLMRSAVAFEVLAPLTLRGHPYSDVLPYDIDTPQVAYQRVGHVVKWQFKTSRTRPLFA